MNKRLTQNHMQIKRNAHMVKNALLRRKKFVWFQYFQFKNRLLQNPYISVY